MIFATERVYAVHEAPAVAVPPERGVSMPSKSAETIRIEAMMVIQRHGDARPHQPDDPNRVLANTLNRCSRGRWTIDTRGRVAQD
jgi:hypothetical protein